MGIRQFNESFKKLYEGIDVEKENMLESDLPIIDQLRGQLHKASSELRQANNFNIKAYEVAFQDVIERLFPDNSWWEVIDLDIFSDLFTNRNPYDTVVKICDSVKPEFLGVDTEEVVEESLDFETDFEDFKSDIYNAIIGILFKWQNKPVSKDDVERAIEWFLVHYTDEDIEILEECANKLSEATMSDEDKADSALIRSMIDKMRVRSNAAFTPEEKSVMAKYGIERDNNTRTLSVDGRDLNRPVDDQTRVGWYKGGSYNNGHDSEINYADRARKLPQRKDSQIFQGPYTVDNDYINAHGYNRSKFKSLQDAERYAPDIPMRDKMSTMRNALRDRKWAQDRIDNADSERAKRMAKAQADYDKAVADADQHYKWDTESSAGSRDFAQKKIDTLLKRNKEESLNESPSKYFTVGYDSNGVNSVVMVKAASEDEARDTYMKLKGDKYPKINSVGAIDDQMADSYKKRGMSCLNESFVPTPWKNKAYEIISDLSPDGAVKMLMAFTKWMSDDEVGEFLHQEGYVEYED